MSGIQDSSQDSIPSDFNVDTAAAAVIANPTGKGHGGTKFPHLNHKEPKPKNFKISSDDEDDIDDSVSNSKTSQTSSLSSKRASQAKDIMQSLILKNKGKSMITAEEVRAMIKSVQKALGEDEIEVPQRSQDKITKELLFERAGLQANTRIDQEKNGSEEDGAGENTGGVSLVPSLLERHERSVMVSLAAS